MGFLFLSLGMQGFCWAQAQPVSPLGEWTQIDDATSKPHSVIKISEKDQILSATVVKLIPFPGEAADPTCRKCEGERKDKPILGMTIIWDMHPDGQQYSGGHILDPQSGSIYKCKIHVSDDGQKLLVRGFLGFSLFGRSQTWLRNPVTSTK